MAIEEVKEEVQAVEPSAPAMDYKAEFERLSRENEKLKQAQSNASADVSRLKKELQSRMTEEEKAKAEREEELANLRKANEEYKLRERISGYKARLLETGYDSETAERMAKVLPEGVTDEFFDSQKLFLESTKNKMRAEALNAQPGITPGQPISSEKIEDKFTAEMRKAAFGR